LQCFATTEEAHDYVLSQVLPTVTADGKVVRPYKNGKDWYLSEKKINLSFPQCDITEQIQLGALTAAPLIGLFVLIFGLRMIRNLIESMTSIGNGDD
ncbi:hypothetical protein, partial [Neisseria viridiae]|uniref:hypothetical protein n=1 Tax=Neisseria viridiae TaxID=2830648 RepID=UPI00265B293F